MQGVSNIVQGSVVTHTLNYICIIWPNDILLGMGESQTVI
jgi:hypothetical protein